MTPGPDHFCPAGLRIASTALLLAAGTNVVGFVGQLDKFREIFENMVSGGMESLPAIPKFLILHQTAMLAAIGIVVAGFVLSVWIPQKLTSVLTGLFTGLFVLGVLGVGVAQIVLQPLNTVITRFQE